MTRKEEIFLSLAYWIASLDGNLDINESKLIRESKVFESFYSKTNFKHCKELVVQLKESTDAKGFLKSILNPLLSADSKDIFSKEDFV